MASAEHKLTACDIELAVARLFGWRQNIIVPNVSWGLHGLGHEADMLVVSPAGWCREIEIKVSGSDIRADLKKPHGHRSSIVRELYFAVPEKLKDHPGIPGHAGLIVVHRRPMDRDARATIVRRVITNRNAVRLSDEQVKKLLSLGCMRVWNLKLALMTKVDRSKIKTKED